jgi:sporulation protein YhbH
MPLITCGRIDKMAIFRDSSEAPIEHDRSIEDRRRHRQLVEKSIKENISDILSEESLVGESGNKKFKIPIKGIKEYQFVYGKNTKGVGSGTGEEKRGQKIGSSEEQGKSKGDKAGNGEGEEIYETEITLEELLDYIMEDLELPYIQRKKYSEIITKSSNRRRGYQKHGINPRLAKKKTVMMKIARKQSMKKLLKERGEVANIERVPFREEDLKYYRIRPKVKKESNAAIVFIMDISASMDNSKKYLARSFFFILSCFIKKKYNNVKMAFVSHTTTAWEVDENEFFHRTESGGTYMSSGLNKALDIISERFPLETWNVYTFYASDGDNWGEDNERTIKAVREHCNICNMLAYIELLPSLYGGSMYGRMTKEITSKNFAPVVIRDKKELWNALKVILGKELKEG